MGPALLQNSAVKVVFQQGDDALGLVVRSVGLAPDAVSCFQGAGGRRGVLVDARGGWRPVEMVVTPPEREFLRAGP